MSRFFVYTKKYSYGKISHLMTGSPYGMDFEGNTGFIRDFIISEPFRIPPSRPEGRPEGSQTAFRPGSAGVKFWPKIMRNVRFYKDFCDFWGSSQGPQINDTDGADPRKSF